MELTELRPGLWRWTAPHPEWSPAAPGSPGDWPREVGCVAARRGGEVVFIDPLVPGARGVWSALDEIASGADRVWALTTIQFHRRSRAEVAARYGASTSRARARLPGWVEPVSIRGAGETMYWLREHRALVVGDRLVGDGAGGVRLCPASWLRYLPSGLDLAGLRRALRPLLDLPAEMVLVSHGDPVLSGGAAALRRALEA